MMGFSMGWALWVDMGLSIGLYIRQELGLKQKLDVRIRLGMGLGTRGHGAWAEHVIGHGAGHLLKSRDDICMTITSPCI